MLEGIDSTKVFTYFEEISNIPRGSGNNTAISNYLVDFAKEHKLSYEQDAYENVIIRKGASKGYEDKPVVMIQGHMDMVCEKEEGCDHDFTKDPLDLKREEDFIFANQTTLGGDDGIAIAYGLAILDDDTLMHPPIELVVTTDEETGMDGAIGLDVSALNGKYLINVDSEEEGVILTSCAGGMSVNGHFTWKRNKENGKRLTIQVGGLQGGHSGTEIHKNRENAVLLLGRVLRELVEKKVECSLISLDGGLKDNAIPRTAKAELLVPETELAKRALEDIDNMLVRELENSEQNFKLSVSFGEETEEYVASPKDFQSIVYFLCHVPNGVQKMSGAISGLVESSLNLGICKTKEDGIFVSFSLRSSLQSYKEYMALQLKDCIMQAGGQYAQKSEYPAWEYRKDSKLRQIASAVYEKQYGKQPVLEAIHAGLECGILSGKMPDLDMISIGPDIFDIHTPKEKMSISSAQRVYQFIIGILEALCES